MKIIPDDDCGDSSFCLPLHRLLSRPSQMVDAAFRRRFPRVCSACISTTWSAFNGTERLTPWPSVQVPEWRLWDAKVTWPDLEPGKGQWHFDDLDKSLGAGGGPPRECADDPRPDAASGLRLVPRKPSGYLRAMRPNPGISKTGGSSCGPSPRATRAVFHAYEIWNEPNVRRGFGPGSVDQLVAMTREAHNIIKEHRSVMPSLFRLPPPACVAHRGWLSFCRKGGGQYVDVIGYHFYVTPRLPEEMAPLALAVRKVMADNGIGGKPIWNTEFGWLPPARFESEEVGAAYLVRGYLLLWAAGVQRSYWYAWDNHTSVALKTSAIDNQPLAAGKAYGSCNAGLPARAWTGATRMQPAPGDAS